MVCTFTAVWATVSLVMLTDVVCKVPRLAGSVLMLGRERGMTTSTPVTFKVFKVRAFWRLDA
jgi:hypothetical protein